MGKTPKAPFKIAGYDKDADVEEILCTAATAETAEMVAKSLIAYHMKKELYRTDTGEPFDWFVIVDSDDEVYKTYTTEEPEGF